MAISLRLTKEEEKIFKSYAEMHNITVTDLVKNAVLTKIQDECDLELFKELLKNTDQQNTIDLAAVLGEHHGL